MLVSADDPVLQEALKKYHQGLITDNNRISELLLVDHGIEMKYVLQILSNFMYLSLARPRTIRKCRDQIGLTGSRKTVKTLNPKEAEQLVMDQMDADATRHQGPRMIRHEIAMRTGKHLPRDYISDIMHTHDLDGFGKPNVFTVSQRCHLVSMSGGQQMDTTSSTESVFRYGLLSTMQLGSG